MASSLSTEQLAPREVRRDEEIFATDGGWFRARWHFSFDEYIDPANMGIGALRVFNHETLAPGAVWPMHSHRDVEGLTHVVAGHFEHADSIGGGGILEPGGVQRMTLGSGAQRSERNHSQTEAMQFLQLWIQFVTMTCKTSGVTTLASALRSPDRVHVPGVEPQEPSVSPFGEKGNSQAVAARGVNARGDVDGVVSEHLQDRAV